MNYDETGWALEFVKNPTSINTVLDAKSYFW